MKSVYGPLVFGLIAVLAFAQAAESTEEEDEDKVQIKLYQVSTSDWTTRGRAEFIALLVPEANKYCDDAPAKCNMQYLKADFISNRYEELSAEKDKAYMVATFKLLLPTTRNMTSGHQSDVYLTKSALEAITINSVDKFRDETDWSIVDVEGQQQKLPPDNTLNIAISVTGVAILLILIIALCIMQAKCGKKSKHQKLDAKETVA